ncbi:hypothetical protein ONA23_00525 [Mycoplasmopsis cynos]|uniref:hypothetical protein n=1 Tax=Mycoplasmopsis cynos TaxID=171284 RepID=UPI0024C5776A|nr:hypothetical protein [Mycoplasmopsis cynos]WAM06750.1 hypothetical protein ONA23_00525 [Mycoplasmopsis cynos]
MILYKIGEIVYKNKNNIIFENKGDGYIVNVANVDRFEVGANAKYFYMSTTLSFIKIFMDLKILRKGYYLLT